jgi:hypothetical protein
MTLLATEKGFVQEPTFKNGCETVARLGNCRYPHSDYVMILDLNHQTRHAMPLAEEHINSRL